MLSQHKRHGSALICAVFFIVAAMTLGWVFVGKIQLCAFRLFTGLPCPGCGLTHAAAALLKGDFSASFQYHPLLLPVLFTLCAACFSEYPFFRAFHANRFFYPAMLVLVFGLYAARLILYFPDGPLPMVYDPCSFAGKIFDCFVK